MEANAKLALMELLNKPMDQSERRDLLRSFAVQHRGTSSATLALEKAEELGVQILTDLASQSGHQAEVSSLLTRLREAARIGARPPRPGAAFERMRAILAEFGLQDAMAQRYPLLQAA